MSTIICHASIDENGNIVNGTAGDQTGKEVCTRAWYNKPWNLMLRYPDYSLAVKAANIAVKLANSNLVGYNQNSRNTLYQQLKKNNFDVDAYIASGIKTETDCSAFLYAVWCCLIPSMRSDSNAPTTSTMKAKYTANGFTAYTDSKYVASTDALKIGDVLDNTGHHTAMVVATDNTSSTTTVTNNSYLVKVTASALNVRKGPSTSYAITTVIHQDEVYTIVGENNGWGKLKSGAGWISLKYTKKI